MMLRPPEIFYVLRLLPAKTRLYGWSQTYLASNCSNLKSE